MRSDLLACADAPRPISRRLHPFAPEPTLPSTENRSSVRRLGSPVADRVAGLEANGAPDRDKGD
jgi:hypothetical protein